MRMPQVMQRPVIQIRPVGSNYRLGAHINIWGGTHKFFLFFIFFFFGGGGHICANYWGHSPRAPPIPTALHSVWVLLNKTHTQIWLYMYHCQYLWAGYQSTRVITDQCLYCSSALCIFLKSMINNPEFRQFILQVQSGVIYLFNFNNNF